MAFSRCFEMADNATPEDRAGDAGSNGAGLRCVAVVVLVVGGGSGMRYADCSVLRLTPGWDGGCGAECGGGSSVCFAFAPVPTQMGRRGMNPDISNELPATN